MLCIMHSSLGEQAGHDDEVLTYKQKCSCDLFAAFKASGSQSLVLMTTGLVSEKVNTLKPTNNSHEQQMMSVD